MRYAVVIGVLAAVVAVAGCTSRQADLTVMANKNVDLVKVAEARKTQNPMPVTGRDTQHFLLFIPLGTRPNLEDALDNALEKANGDCMVDAVIYWKWWNIILYGQTAWEVKGRALNTYGVKVGP
jgi:hypothetical protein